VAQQIPRFLADTLTAEEVESFFRQAFRQLEMRLLQAYLNVKMHPELEHFRQEYDEIRRQLGVARREHARVVEGVKDPNEALEATTAG
jgi:hypothetical protein